MELANFTLSMPIVKVDEEQRIVYGIATQEVLDKQNEIVDYEASKKAFKNWEGNIREMHDPKKAVGKKIDLAFDDDNKQVMVGARISRSADGENTWTKVKEGILAGFSIGGRVKKVDNQTHKDADGNDTDATVIKDYDLTELSLVDNPACPTAKIVMVKSMDGTAIEVPYVEERVNDPRPHEFWGALYKSEGPSQDTKLRLIEKSLPANNLNKRDFSDKERAQLADSGAALPDGSYPIKTTSDLENAIQAFGRAKDPGKVKAHIIRRARALGATNKLPEDWTDGKGETSEMKKVDYNVRPQDGEQATRNAVEPGRGVDELEQSELNESDKEELPGGQAEGRDSTNDDQAMYNEREQDGARAQEEGTEPGRGVAEEQRVEEDAGVITVNGVKYRRVENAAKPADLTKSEAMTALVKALAPELVKALKPATTKPVEKSNPVEAKVDALLKTLKALESRLEIVEAAPAAGPTPKKYATVDKVDGGDGEEDTPEAEYQALIKKAAELPATASLSERNQLAFALRKAARKFN